jgi:hypothetical protein
LLVKRQNDRYLQSVFWQCEPLTVESPALPEAKSLIAASTLTRLGTPLAIGPLVGNIVERIVRLTTQNRDDGDTYYCDERQHERVFDHRGAFFVLDEALDKSEHRVRLQS